MVLRGAVFVALGLLLGCGEPSAGPRLRLELRPGQGKVKPLELLGVRVSGAGTVQVRDARGRVYQSMPASSLLRFRVGGQAGAQQLRLLDDDGHVVDSMAFQVEAETSLKDEGGRMATLLQLLESTMRTWTPGLTDGVGQLRWHDRDYRFYVHWLRDHVHMFKGMRYFDGSGAEILEVFRDSQREDGMIWDFFRGGLAEGNFYDTAFEPHGFARRLDGLQFARMPVEADVEYLFVEGIYLAWKMTGDDPWMASYLDAAVRAMDYSASHPERWSSAYQLIRRGYTIDTWDFQHEATSAGLFPRWSSILIDPSRSRFGVMFGDNLGYAAACMQLAEMLQWSRRLQDAERFRERAAAILERVNRLSWMSKRGHYRHWVPEEPRVLNKLAPQAERQLSLSNAYAINRGIGQEKAAAIIEAYQELRDHLPSGAPGEWYGIYPPFEHGFEDHARPWQYVNGGVLPLVAGELARGAFHHGYEGYGADILQRVLKLAEKHGNRVHFAYTGAHLDAAEPEFTVIDLSPYATMDLGGQGAQGVPNWMESTPDDHLAELPTGRHDFAGVPFLVADPAKNGRRAVAAVSGRDSLPARIEIPVGQRAAALYLLHSTGDNDESQLAGSVVLNYQDGTHHTQYLLRGHNVAQWWYPDLSEPSSVSSKQAERQPLVKLAFRGRNDACTHIGMYWFGLNNPTPDKTIESVTLVSADNRAIYALAGLTLSNEPLHMPRSEVSYGGPGGWAAAAVTHALIEGLMGVEERKMRFEEVTVAPRWAVTDSKRVEATVHMPASHAYVSYVYTTDGEQIELLLTGSGSRARCHVLLPAAHPTLRRATVDGRGVPFTVSSVANSDYADVEVPLPGPVQLRLEFAAQGGAGETAAWGGAGH